MSKIPIFQTGLLRPRIRQGMAGSCPLELCPGLSSLFLQGHTLRSRPWGTSGDPESRPGPSPHPLCSLLTFSDFNAGAMKNKVQPVPHASLLGPAQAMPDTIPLAQSQAQCVQEVFLRQLMQVRGVSGEKAAAIVGQYSTPAR